MVNFLIKLQSFTGMVKTATKGFPMQELRQRCPEARGMHVFATTTGFDNTNIIAMAWQDKKCHTFIGSCGTTLGGEDARKRRYDQNGRRFHKFVKRPQLVEEYHNGSGAIDAHNHARQGGIQVEKVWKSKYWHNRIYGSLIGIIETNAFFAYKFFTNNRTLEHVDFRHDLATSILNLNRNEAVPVVPVEQGLNQIENRNLFNAHTLISYGGRKQITCIVCSRVRRQPRKASFYCVECGERAAICGANTGRDCYAYHLMHGVPA